MESLPLAKSALRSSVMGVFLNISRDKIEHTHYLGNPTADLASGKLSMKPQ